MAKNVAIGIQSFEDLIKGNYFYIDKTGFIKEWWDSGDSVTLITRPRRFGKTLNMSMLEQFFSIKYAGRGELFEGLSIWNEEAYGAENTVAVHIRHLREKIEYNPAEPRYLKAVWGRGYKIE